MEVFGSVMIVITRVRRVVMCINIQNVDMLYHNFMNVIFVVKSLEESIHSMFICPIFTEIQRINKNILDISHEIRSKMIKFGNVWRCTDCDYSSPKTTNLYRHIESKHVPTPIYSCQYCGKVFKGINYYSSHMSTSHRMK